MKAMLPVLTLAAAALTGCASPPPAATAPAAAADGATATAAAPLTGSRLARASSDRLIKGINNATFQRDWEIRSIHNEVGLKSN